MERERAVYSRKDIKNEFGITPDQLEVMERRGLLVPYTDRIGTRTYTIDMVYRAAFVNILRGEGLSYPNIVQILLEQIEYSPDDLRRIEEVLGLAIDSETI